MTELFVDNFAGGGGASTGIELAIGRSVDIAVDHDPDAIAMHRANHPTTTHYCENIWEVDPYEACGGRPVALAWFSPDCKHFSRAKGGKPLDRNIRGLAWVALRWAAKVRPRVIMLENVPEIMTWGPLGADNLPIKEKQGCFFRSFVRQLKGHGYEVEWRLLKSCDYGAPTTRLRFYLIARCDGKPIVFPEPTHGERRDPKVQNGELAPYRTAAECIDWSIPATSIFERDKPLAENTLRRIARGIKKYVIDNPEPFIVTVNHGGDGFRGQSLKEPLHTVTAKHGYGIVAPTLIQYHSETNAHEVRGQSIDEPLMTQDTSNRYALSCAHIMKNYGGNYTGAGTAPDAPLDTVTAKDHNSLVTAHIMTMRNHMGGQRMDEPLGTITAGTTHHAEVQAFLAKYFSTGAAKPVNEPLDTITTKDRFALVTIHGEEYIITDIRMRMLQPRELFNAQGFPEDYRIDQDADGKAYPKSKQVARCGNAVTPPVATALVRANLPEYCGNDVTER